MGQKGGGTTRETASSGLGLGTNMLGQKQLLFLHPSKAFTAKWWSQYSVRYLTCRYWLLKGLLHFGRKQLNKETAVLINLLLSMLQPCLWYPSFLSPGILYTNKLQGLNFLHFIHCPCHGYLSHSYCYCFHPLLSLPKPLFLFLALIFLLLWDAYCLSCFSPAVLNWPLRKAVPSIITYHCWFSLTERNDCCRGCPGPDDRWLDVCYGCSLQIHEQQKFPFLWPFYSFLNVCWE